MSKTYDFTWLAATKPLQWLAGVYHRNHTISSGLRALATLGLSVETDFGTLHIAMLTLFVGVTISAFLFILVGSQPVRGRPGAFLCLALAAELSTWSERAGPTLQNVPNLLSISILSRGACTTWPAP